MKRIAVITGAASGIGAALARGLAKEQYDLVLVGRNVDALSATAEDIISQTPQCNVQCKSADLTNLDDRSTVFSAVASAGVNDILLINNAGISHFGTLASNEDASLEKLFATNVLAPMALTRLFVAGAKKGNQRLSVINIGSTFGAIGYPGFSGYCASKFAIRGFSEALSRELADEADVSIRYFAPRATKTGFNSEQINAMNAELGVTMDSPEVVAREFIRFLESDKATAHIGWPERFFVWLNKIAPALVSSALKKQLSTIKKYAAANK